VTAIAAIGIGWLAASLPAEGFYSGDSGLKLIAARNAINHPGRPLDVDLPTSGGNAMPYVDPMVALHEGHGDILQSPLFPLISAPAIAALGLRGAYVLPAIAFVVLLSVLDVIRRHAAPDSSFALLAWIAVAANPLFFYALEFWEHSVAVVLVAASLAAAVIGGRSAHASSLLASGALAGVAALLRPEAVWFVNNGAYRMAQFGHHLQRHRAIMCPTFVRQMDRVATYSAAELYDAIFQRTRLYRQVQAWFDSCDIVAMPTLSRSAVPIDQDFFGPIEIDNQLVENIRAAWYPYTMPFNLTGNPAVSLPCGFDGAGMPLAIQLVARPGADAELLRMAAAFEAARPWRQHRPA